MDEEYFIEKSKQFQHTVFRIALNYLRNIDDAEDIVQEVWLKYYNSQKTFESDAHIRNWLIRVTINACKNLLRSPWRKRRVALDEMVVSISFDYEEQGELFVSVMKLPEKNRVVLYLFYYEELTVKEIAEILKLSETAVTSRLSRARSQLRLLITEV